MKATNKEVNNKQYQITKVREVKDEVKDVKESPLKVTNDVDEVKSEDDSNVGEVQYA